MRQNITKNFQEQFKRHKIDFYLMHRISKTQFTNFSKEMFDIQFTGTQNIETKKVLNIGASIFNPVNQFSLPQLMSVDVNDDDFNDDDNQTLIQMMDKAQQKSLQYQYALNSNINININKNTFDRLDKKIVDWYIKAVTYMSQIMVRSKQSESRQWPLYTIKTFIYHWIDAFNNDETLDNRQLWKRIGTLQCDQIIDKYLTPENEINMKQQWELIATGNTITNSDKVKIDNLKINTRKTVHDEMKRCLDALFDDVATECDKEMDNKLDSFWKGISETVLQDKNEKISQENDNLRKENTRLNDQLREFELRETIDYYLTHYWWILLILLMFGFPICILTTMKAVCCVLRSSRRSRRKHRRRKKRKQKERAQRRKHLQYEYRQRPGGPNGFVIDRYKSIDV